MAPPQIKRKKISDYTPALINPNAGSEQGTAALEDSLQQFGAGRSGVADKDGEMIGGSHILQAAVNAGIEDVIEVESDGKALVIVKRTDLDLTTDARARGLQLADNRMSQLNYVPDEAVIASILADMGSENAPLVKAAGFNESDVKAVMEGMDEAQTDALTRYDVPDAIFPTDNDFGIPVLLSELQADALDAPVSTWRESHWSGKSGGTILFYLDDSRFNALWQDPTALIKTQPITIVEPNFSMNIVTPRALCLWTIYRKRWLARYWQGFGIHVFVDLNVSGAAPYQYEDNLLGVPKGWKAYATRAHSEQHEAVEREFEIACEHSGVSRPLFVVYGGGKAMQARCKERQWIWIPEPSEFARSFNFGKQQK